MRARPLIRACWATVLLAACGVHEPQTQNVLLISIDTLRADYLSSYGFPRETTPHIDDLARQGALFRNVQSPVPITLPAHASMLTGTVPPYHGVRDNLNHRLADSIVTLAELLKAKGFVTGAIVSSFVLDSRFNLSQGFDTYNDRFEEVHKIHHLSERKGDETTRLAEAWLEEHRGQRFFLFLHYYDPHDGYQPPEPFASRFADDGYAGEVAFADYSVGEVVGKLKELGIFDSTLLVITSDHGEMLGEHGELTHGFFVYQSALKVPLVIRLPGRSAPRQVDPWVGLIDVMPTIAGLVGAEVPKEVQGENLSQWLLGPSSPAKQRQFYMESFTAPRYYGTNSLLGLISGRWKYIETSRPELYDLERDPEERVNLIEREPRIAQSLENQLKQVLKAHTREKETRDRLAPDEASRRRMESLGYLGGSGYRGDAIDFDRSKEDPKDLISFYREDQRLAELIEDKNYPEAEALGKRMLRERPDFVEGHLQLARIAIARADAASALRHASKAAELDPGNAQAHIDLARILRSLGKLEESTVHYRRALELRPGFEEARTELAHALTGLGRFDEAATELKEALTARPSNVEAAIQLGFALASQGKLDEAIDQYRRALALDSRSAEAHSYLGSALASRGRVDEAIAHFEKALEAQPDLAEIHNWLGVALRERGRTEEAVRHFREALRLTPELAVAHLNLGVALKEQGRLEEAVQHYRRAIALNPNLPAAHNHLGTVLGSQGHLAEAVSHFREALQADPNDGETHNNLGLALRMVGERDAALKHFRAALAQRPDWPEPMNEVAWILATHPDDKVRNPDEAVRLAERAAELTGHREPLILDTLAAACAAAGDFLRAVETAQAAVALATEESTGLANEIGKRLELYRKQKAFREPARLPPYPSL